MYYYKKDKSLLVLSEPLEDATGYEEITKKQYDAILAKKQKRIDDLLKSDKSKILVLKKQLADTDYQAIKYAEGLLTEEEYAPIKAQRQAWRDQINQLEAKNESVS